MGCSDVIVWIIFILFLKSEILKMVMMIIEKLDFKALDIHVGMLG